MFAYYFKSTTSNQFLKVNQRVLPSRNQQPKQRPRLPPRSERLAVVVTVVVVAPALDVSRSQRKNSMPKWSITLPRRQLKTVVLLKPIMVMRWKQMSYERSQS
jgi:hypothetical protein